jgi:hypothetical protein
MTQLYRSQPARRARERPPGLAALAAAAAILAPAAATAAPWVLDCPTGCLLTPDEAAPFTVFNDDYTVPADGLTHLWTFRLVSDDPDATVRLGDPNEVFTIRHFGGGGTDDVPFAPFVFDQHIAPLLTTISVRTRQDYNHCTPSTPLGQLCGETFNVWGNSSGLILYSQVPAVFYTSDSIVPEPGAWTLMIAGFGAAGARLRRRGRRTAAAA